MTRPLRTVPPRDPDDAADLERRRKYLAGPAALLGGPANVVMQLSHAPVGRGVIESSVDSGRYDLRPNKRGRTTLTYLAVAMIGTDEDRAAFREAVNTAHRQVRTKPDSPIKYNAFDPKLQLWVAACLYQGSVDSLTLLFGPMDEATTEDHYREAARFGTTLQVPQEMWPADRAAFEAYWAEMEKELSLDDEVKKYLIEQVIELGPYPRFAQIAFAPVNRFFSTGFLPQAFRDQLGLRWSPRRQRLFERIMRTIGLIISKMPESVRLYPFETYLADMRERRAQGKSLI
ncbi:oxygenase MpaB family protein [Nocardia takedensis]|uniref:oxygenase MpaB family protein n=1 Tax=Nocardia takedensis TaxID=259390 RepID=UPI00030157E5|nr:oxygenase MpaB family protein [Nocardia takedensis]